MAEKYRVVTDIDVFDDPYQALANEVIKTAAEDYVAALTFLRLHQEAPAKEHYLTSEQIRLLRTGTSMTHRESRQLSRIEPEYVDEEYWTLAQTIAWRQELAERVRRTPEYMAYNRDIRRYNKIDRERADLEAFFRSDLYKLMTRVDGEWLIDTLTMQAEGTLDRVKVRMRGDDA